MAEGKFPKPIRLTERCVAWLLRRCRGADPDHRKHHCAGKSGCRHTEGLAAPGLSAATEIIKMARSIPFGRFKSKKAARANAQRILKEYLNKGPIPKPDLGDVADLLNNHPDKLEKIGTGVQHICVELENIPQRKWS